MADQAGEPDAARPILLIEDDRTLADLIARHLEAHGHRVVVAGSAEEAEETTRAGLVPRIVLLDINLPGSSGWGFLRHATLQAMGDPPVVIVSAVPISSHRLAEFHVAGYLPKPFAMPTLLATIERLVGAQGGPTEP